MCSLFQSFSPFNPSDSECLYFLLLFHTVSSTGAIIYSEIRAFLEKQPNKMTYFKSIATVNETFFMTGNHLIFARETFAAQFNPM